MVRTSPFGTYHPPAAADGAASAPGRFPLDAPAPPPAGAPVPNDATGAHPNPWVEAVRSGRTEFAGAFGDLARGRQNWRTAAMYSLAANVVLALGLGTLATQARITPYIVREDRLGRVQWGGTPDRLSRGDPKVAEAAVAQWVHDIRGVSGDPLAQRDVVERAYKFVDASVAGFLQSYFTDPAHDPRVLGRDLTRLVEITSQVRVPAAGGRRGAAAPTTWKVSWTETDYPRAGGQPTTTAWEGYLTTQVVPPTTKDLDVVQVNPTGIRVTAVQWGQVSARAATATPLGNASADPYATAPAAGTGGAASVPNAPAAPPVAPAPGTVPGPAGAPAPAPTPAPPAGPAPAPGGKP